MSDNEIDERLKKLTKYIEGKSDCFEVTARHDSWRVEIRIKANVKIGYQAEFYTTIQADWFCRVEYKELQNMIERRLKSDILKLYGL